MYTCVNFKVVHLLKPNLDKFCSCYVLCLINIEVEIPQSSSSSEKSPQSSIPLHFYNYFNYLDFNEHIMKVTKGF